MTVPLNTPMPVTKRDLLDYIRAFELDGFEVVENDTSDYTEEWSEVWSPDSFVGERCTLKCNYESVEFITYQWVDTEWCKGWEPKTLAYIDGKKYIVYV